MKTGLSQMVFWATALSTLIVGAISGPTLGQNGSPDEIAERQMEVDLQAAALWMLDQPEPVRQAAGLLLQQKSETSSAQTTDNPAALQARIADLLDQSDDPLTLALLAAVCHQTGIQNRCLDLGLDEAIIEHGQGNAISLSYLFPEGSERFENALLSTRKVDDYLFPIAEVWDRALEEFLDVGTDTERHMLASFGAMSIMMAISVPGYAVLRESCKNEIGDSALALACARISGLANQSHNSLILRIVGLGLAKEQALAAADEALADQIETEQQNLQSRIHCIYQEIPESHWSESNEFTSNWIRSAARRGEVGAIEALGEHYNVGCPEHFS